jgi:hypothetical protein
VDLVVRWTEVGESRLNVLGNGRNFLEVLKIERSFGRPNKLKFELWRLL